MFDVYFFLLSDVNKTFLQAFAYMRALTLTGKPLPTKKLSIGQFPKAIYNLISDS